MLGSMAAGSTLLGASRSSTSAGPGTVRPPSFEGPVNARPLGSTGSYRATFTVELSASVVRSGATTWAPSGQHPSAASARLPAMAFGQQSGPPASQRQVKELLALLNDAGHTDFREARGPMGFTQRQAAGKFTRDEAEAFIARLQGNEPDGASLAVVPAAKLSTQEQLLRHLPAEQLAAELRRRGWTVTDPGASTRRP